MAKTTTQAVGYLRTSSATNVGTDKDSEARQRSAIKAFAKRSGFELVDCFYDAAVSGRDPIMERQGFAALLERIAGNGVRTVIVEDVSRFARDLITQETGIAALQALDVRVFAANGDDLTESEDEMRVAMRQIAGVFSQLEKARLVAKLRKARERVKAKTGKCEGRKALAETNPEAVAMAQSLRRKRKGKPLSLRAISAEMAAHGLLNERGKPFNPKSVMVMLAG